MDVFSRGGHMKHVTLFPIALMVASVISGCDELIPGWGGSGGGRISSYPMHGPVCQSGQAGMPDALLIDRVFDAKSISTAD